MPNFVLVSFGWSLIGHIAVAQVDENKEQKTSETRIFCRNLCSLREKTTSSLINSYQESVCYLQTHEHKQTKTTFSNFLLHLKCDFAEQIALAFEMFGRN